MKITCVAIILLVALSAGCAARPEQNAELERELETLRAENQELERIRRTQQRRIEELQLAIEDLEEERRKLEPAQSVVKADEIARQRGLPAEAGLEFQIEGLSFVFLTTAMDWDGDSLDDGISVYIAPRDSEGDAIKREGAFYFELYGLGKKEEPPTMQRYLPKEEVITKWALFPTCFHFRLKWQEGKVPSERALLSARFESVLGKTVTTSMELDIRVK